MTDIIDRLINSEEHATEEAIPQVAYDAVEEIKNLREKIDTLNYKNSYYTDLYKVATETTNVNQL